MGCGVPLFGAAAGIRLRWLIVALHSLNDERAVAF